MEIHGREIHFRRSVEANCNIAEICPDKDPNKFNDLINGPYIEAQKSAAVFMSELSKAYEKEQKYNEPGYVENPLTFDEALLLDNDVFNDLFMEAIDVFADDGKTTVEAEAPKAKGKNGNGDGE